MLFALMYLIMFCFVVQDRRAYHRVLIVLAVCVLLAIRSGGVAEGELARLEVEDVAGGFGNTNALAFLAGVLSIALLFWTLGAGLFRRVLILTLAGSMFVVLLWTVRVTVGTVAPPRPSISVGSKSLHT